MMCCKLCKTIGVKEHFPPPQTHPYFKDVCLVCWDELPSPQKMSHWAASQNLRVRKHFAQSDEITSSECFDLLIDSKGFCGYCKEFFGYKKLTLDHITPLSLGGLNKIENLRIACRVCNSRKGNKIWTEKN